VGGGWWWWWERGSEGESLRVPSERVCASERALKGLPRHTRSWPGQANRRAARAARVSTQAQDNVRPNFGRHGGSPVPVQMCGVSPPGASGTMCAGPELCEAGPSVGLGARLRLQGSKHTAAPRTRHTCVAFVRVKGGIDEWDSRGRCTACLLPVRTNFARTHDKLWLAVRARVPAVRKWGDWSLEHPKAAVSSERAHEWQRNALADSAAIICVAWSSAFRDAFHAGLQRTTRSPH
jgi:hypothetical protein